MKSKKVEPFEWFLKHESDRATLWYTNKKIQDHYTTNAYHACCPIVILHRFTLKKNGSSCTAYFKRGEIPPGDDYA